MNATDFYSRRIFGIDYRVWATMLSVSFLSLVLYGFKQIRFDDFDELSCPIDTIAIDGRKVEVVADCYLNRYSPFAVEADAGATVEWNFSDGTRLKKGQVVIHKFLKEGIYKVTATVNGRCRYEAEVEVVEDPFAIARQQRPVVEIFADPMRPTVGSSVQLYCVSDIPSITSYEWRISNTDEVQRVAEPTFTFKDKGNYTVQLLINNDPSKIWSTVIQVTNEISPSIPGDVGVGAGAGMPVDAGSLGRLVTAEASSGIQVNTNAASNQTTSNQTTNNQSTSRPDTLNKSTQPRAPEVDPKAFQDLLQSVVNEEGKELEDLYEYLDYKGSTTVEIEEGRSLISLKEFCKKMRNKNKSKRKIEAVSFKIDDRKSIQTIIVKMRANEGFWDRLNPFN